jgi:NTF2 fold immunity protein
MTKFKCLAIALLFTNVAVGQTTQTLRRHPDYVPDQKTAEAIGKAVLIARFGEDSVKAQLPLYVTHGVGDYWIVQGGVTGSRRIGGGMAVWINEHSGCIENVLTHMK